MNIRLWKYNILQRLDKLVTFDKVDLNDAELDQFIRRGVISWLNDQVQKGVEMYEINDQKISTLILNEQLTTISTTDPYEFPLSNLTYNCYYIMRVTADFIGGDCTKSNEELFRVQYDDLHYVLNDPYRGPSLDWGTGLYTLGKSSSTLGQKSIFVYTNNEYVPSNLRMTYIKTPEIPSIGGYTDIDGINIYPTVESDLPEEHHDEIIDKIVELIAVAINDPAVSLYRSTYIENQ